MVKRLFVVLLICFSGSVAFAAPAPKPVERPKIKELPAELVQIWEAVGAKAGWMEVDATGTKISGFVEHRDLKIAPKERWMPAFQFEKWPTKSVWPELPVPETLFGISVDGDSEDELIINKDQLTELKPFKTLAHLELISTFTTLEGSTVLSGLKYLIALTLENCAVTTKGLTELKDLPSLRSLTLIDAVAEKAWEGFGELKQITFLSLELVELGDDGLAELAKMSDLVSLNLNEVEITDDGLKHLKNLKKLKALTLGADNITSKGMKEIGKVTQLTSLDLELLTINDAGLKELAPLKELEFLNLYGSDITDKGLAHLKDMTKLTKLSLAVTEVTDEGLKVVSNFPDLKHLDLNGVEGVTDAGLKHLEGLKKLKWLDIAETGVTARGLRLLAGKKLEFLAISDKLQRDAGLKNYLNAIEVGKTLDLSEWTLTDRSMATIAGYKQLEELNLSTSRNITVKGIAPLLTLTELKSITLSKKVATEEMKKEFANALPKCKIHVTITTVVGGGALGRNAKK